MLPSHNKKRSSLSFQRTELHCHIELQYRCRRADTGSSRKEAGSVREGPPAQSVWDGREGRGFLRSSLGELMQDDGVQKRLRNSSGWEAGSWNSQEAKGG